MVAVAFGHAQHVGGWWEQIALCLCAVPGVGIRSIVQNALLNFKVSHADSPQDDCHFVRPVGVSSIRLAGLTQDACGIEFESSVLTALATVEVVACWLGMSTCFQTDQWADAAQSWCTLPTGGLALQ